MLPESNTRHIPKGKTRETQAERILRRFGGARRLAYILQTIGRPRNFSTIYKWTYPKERGGTGGFIPYTSWNDILAAARAEGILISSEDMDPRSS